MCVCVFYICLAKEVMEEWGEPIDAAIRPEHLQEAHRRYRMTHRPLVTSNSMYKRRLFS